MTLGQYLTELWLPAVRSSVRPSTWTAYQADIPLYVVPRIGDLPLQTLTRNQLRVFYGELELNGGCGTVAASAERRCTTSTSPCSRPSATRSRTS